MRCIESESRVGDGMPGDAASEAPGRRRTLWQRARARLRPEPDAHPPVVPSPRREPPLPEGFDRDRVLGLLSSLEQPGGAAEELRTYLHSDLDRFLHTWGMTRDLSGRCLELGASPYYTTLLLIHFSQLEPTLANYFSPDFQQGPLPVAYQCPRTGARIERTLTFDHFNVESEPFPYADDSFEAVLFCEILEHLVNDPLFALREIKRVLAPGGRLILTTPNVARLENVARMIAGVNIYDPYSAYGPYGRHNREYNFHELKQLLDHAGFSIELAFASDVYDNLAHSYARPEDLAPAMSTLEGWLGQYLFVRARNDGEARTGRPAFLYRSYPSEELE